MGSYGDGVYGSGNYGESIASAPSLPWFPSSQTTSTPGRLWNAAAPVGPAPITNVVPAAAVQVFSPHPAEQVAERALAASTVVAALAPTLGISASVPSASASASVPVPALQQVQPTVSYADEVLADSPLAYWRMDNDAVVGLAAANTGSAATSFTYGPNVVLGNAPLVADGGHSVAGPGSNAVALSAGIPASLQSTTVTLECVVNIPVANVSGYFVKLGGTVGWGVGIGGTTMQSTSLGKQIMVGITGLSWGATGVTLTNGIHHIAVIRNGTNAFTLVVDGVSVWSGAPGTPSKPDQVIVGGSAPGDGGLYLSSSVQIDAVAVYGTALTVAQVQAHFNAMSSGYGQVVAADAPVICLPLDETNASNLSPQSSAMTTLFDSSGNSRSITPTNAPLATTGLIAGDTTPAVLLNGSNQSLSIAPAAWMPDATISVEAWINLSDVASEHFLVARDVAGPNATGRYWNLRQQSGQLWWHVWNSNGTLVSVSSAASALVSGTTYHIAATYDGTTMRLYLDGVEVAFAAQSGLLNGGASGPQPLLVGRSNAPHAYLSGTVDEVAVYGVALSAARITAHYDAGTGATPTPTPVTQVVPAASVTAFSPRPAERINEHALAASVAASASAPTLRVSQGIPAATTQASVSAPVLGTPAPQPITNVVPAASVTAFSPHPAESVAERALAATATVGVAAPKVRFTQSVPATSMGVATPAPTLKSGAQAYAIPAPSLHMSVGLGVLFAAIPPITVGISASQGTVRRIGYAIPASRLTAKSFGYRASLPPIGLAASAWPPVMLDALKAQVNQTGSGSSAVASAVMTIIPEFQVSILDDVISRAPTVITVSVAGGVPQTSATFSIDGTDVWTQDLDSAGNLGATSLPVTRDIGGQAGSHTLTVTQMFDGAVLTGAADYTVLRDPHNSPIAVGDDAQAISVPGAVVGGVRHFIIQDLLSVDNGGIGSYIFPINPSKMTSPHYELALRGRHTTSKDGQYHVFQAGQMPKEWTLSGYCPTQDMADKLLAYRKLNRRLYIIDHHNRAWKCIITDLQFDHHLRQNYNGVETDWGLDYTLTATVVDQNFWTPA